LLNGCHSKPPSTGTALRLYIGGCLVVWVSKLYALYGSHDIWASYSPVYVGAVAGVASYREFLLVAALSAAYVAAARQFNSNGFGVRLFKGAILTALGLVAVVNFVNAELLSKLGAPLTLPLIRYSDVLASAHGRDSLWAWTSSGILLLGLGILVTGIALDALVRIALRLIPDQLLLAVLVLASASVVAVGIIRSPVPANLGESGTLALLRSLRSAASDLPQSGEPAKPPFKVTGVEAGLPRSPGPPLRNVVLVVIEAAAAQYLDEYGGSYGITPFVSARSGQSVVIRNAYSQSTSSTLALKTLLESRYPYVSMLGEPGATRPNLPLLPQILRDAGFRTAFFHSSDMRFGDAGDFLSTSGFQTVRDYRQRRCNDGLLEDRYSSLGNSDRCTFADLARWLDQGPDKPFFAMIWTFQTHYPYFAQQQHGARVHAPALPTSRARAEMQRYLNAIREADALIEGLIRRLEQSNRYEDTLIVVTGDHGQAFGQHGTFGNGTSTYEESVRVPLIFLNPRLTNARSFDRLGAQIDIAPTILDALGRPRPESWDGVSLFDPAAQRPIHFANMTTDMVLGYRFGDRKVIANFVRGTTEIYDLKADPEERHNLALPSSNEGRRERDWLATWARKINDQWKASQ
jgi:arylsulfatase A-like enzyme